ncbi:DUF2975 domain-containing protein [Paenibacillus alvei]|uniref:DUF2975 domain-containing protein n=1 Tax=Paenibacillus alvei TaxID=44250 RepID=UPI003D2E04D7
MGVLYFCCMRTTYFYTLTIVPTVVVSFLALAIGFLSLTLAQLFEEATRIKEENDQTI